MYGELLEMRQVDLTPLGPVQAGGLGARQCPLNHWMRNAQIAGEGPVRPIAGVREQTAENEHVRTLRGQLVGREDRKGERALQAPRRRAW